MTNISCEEGSFSSGEEVHLHTSNNNISSITTSNGSTSQSQQQQNKQQPLAKKKRNLPGNPGKIQFYIQFFVNFMIKFISFIHHQCKHAVSYT